MTSNQPLPIIHHLSSSGGTLVCRILAAMPRIALLSEVHPRNMGGLRFNPFDPVALFAETYPHLCPDRATLYALFRERIETVRRLCVEADRQLVVRGHAHSDFLLEIGEGRLAIREALGDTPLAEAATIRDPVDSWLSMIAAEFAHACQGFDDYCRRVEAFAGQFPTDRIFTYEALRDAPSAVMSSICDVLGLTFHPEALETVNAVNLTGDSGRGAAMDQVTALPRRAFSPAFRREVMASEAYGRLADRFGYPRDPMDAA